MPHNLVRAEDAAADLDALTARLVGEILGPFDGQPMMLTAAQLQQLIGSAWMMGARVVANTAEGRRTCRICGCWEMAACVGGCAWAAGDLCTACEVRP